MKKILVFGGTTEQHALIEQLAALPVAVTLSVASAYGRSLLPEESGRLRVLTGRLDAAQMGDLLRAGGYCCVVDATHPYAVAASANIRRAAERCDLPYLRLLRDHSDYADCLVVESPGQAVAELNKADGAVLLTIGSKELARFTAVREYRSRLYARVLPTAEALAICAESGIAASHIIAMQGPFSRELNLALLRQLRITALVTKDGGTAGGFEQKLQAAQELGVLVIVIRRPAESGLTETELLRQLTEIVEEQR